MGRLSDFGGTKPDTADRGPLSGFACPELSRVSRLPLLRLCPTNFITATVTVEMLAGF
jgi:hypothetical protein